MKRVIDNNAAKKRTNGVLRTKETGYMIKNTIKVMESRETRFLAHFAITSALGSTGDRAKKSMSAEVM
jgi:hypothetical protein